MDSRTGIVLRIDAKQCSVEVDGRVYRLTPRGKLFEGRRGQKYPIAVGDRVRVVLEQSGGSIEAVLPRRTRLARTAAGESAREQVLVANVDLVLVVASLLEPAFRTALVDRILAGAEREEIEAKLVINKVDLEPSGSTGGAARSWGDFYRQLGYSALCTSTITGEGIDELRAELGSHITVLCGPSGVGKSSLLNAVEPGLELQVGRVSRRGAREGRHTTTHTSLLRLASGGHVVDTPGVRNFGLFELEPGEVAWLFPEMRDLLGQCAFDDCSHTHEPDCRIKRRLSEGRIATSRYDSYRELLAEAQEGTL